MAVSLCLTAFLCAKVPADSDRDLLDEPQSSPAAADLADSARRWPDLPPAPRRMKLPFSPVASLRSSTFLPCRLLAHGAATRLPVLHLAFALIVCCRVPSQRQRCDWWRLRPELAGSGVRRKGIDPATAAAAAAAAAAASAAAAAASAAAAQASLQLLRLGLPPASALKCVAPWHE